MFNILATVTLILHNTVTNEMVVTPNLTEEQCSKALTNIQAGENGYCTSEEGAQALSYTFIELEPEDDAE